MNVLEVVRLARQGHSSDDIALIFGISEAEVAQAVLSPAFSQVQRVLGCADTYCRWESIQELESKGLDALLAAVQGDTLTISERIAIQELLDDEPVSAE